MSMLIGNGVGPRAAPGLGQWLASFTAGQEPMLPPASMQAAPSQPGLGQMLMGAVGPAPLPAPVPRYQSASPGSGGVPPAPMSGAEPVRPRIGDGFDLPRIDVAPQMPPMQAPQPNKMSKGQLIAGIVADGLAGFTGQRPTFGPMMQRQRELADQRSYEETRWHRDRQAKREDAMQPRVEQVGDALGTYDPVLKSFQPIYTKPQPFEAYAKAQGHQPGTPDYAQAVEDYRLGGWSDPAFENRSGLEDMRARSRNALEIMRGANRLRDTETRMATSRENNIRSTGTSAANNQRSTATSAANNVRSTSQSNTNNLRSTTTTQGSASYQGRGGSGRGSRAGAGGATARIINPQTGRAAVLKNGGWVDEQTGKPLQ